MDKSKIDWIKLSLLSNIGPIRTHGLLQEFGDPHNVLSASFEELRRVNGIGTKLAAVIISSRDSIDIKNEIALIEKNEVGIVTIADPEYPANLKNIYSPPCVLYVKGDLRPGDYYSIAVVGTRRASFYGLESSEKFAIRLAQKGFTVVSGLARGIDTAAHRGALHSGGRTIAVLGCGVNVAYPPENKGLMEKISKQGAVISEFPMSTPPERHNFPARNRIISGLSMGVLVVEAGQKSGALITASFALDEGREVFSIPGRVDSLTSRGTLGLIKDGAKLVENIDDILEEVRCPGPMELCANTSGDALVNCALDKHEKSVFDNLGGFPKHIDEIIRNTDLGSSGVSNILVKLQLKGAVKEVPGKRFMKVS